MTQKPLFIRLPSLGFATLPTLVRLRHIIAPVVKSVAGPPITQPSLLPGLIVVMRCNSPVIMVLDRPSEMSANLVLTLTRPKMPQRFAAVSSALPLNGAGKKLGE